MGTKNPFATQNARRWVGVGNKDPSSRISALGRLIIQSFDPVAEDFVPVTGLALG